VAEDPILRHLDETQDQTFPFSHGKVEGIRLDELENDLAHHLQVETLRKKVERVEQLPGRREAVG